MKLIGTALIALGIALLLFCAYLFLSNKDDIVSPVPDSDGVRVIFITPTK